MLKHKNKLLAVLLSALLAAGCTDTTRAKYESYGDKQVVCLLSDAGTPIKKWVSSGKVDSFNGGLHVFNDSKTNMYVKVSGGAVVSTHDYCPEISG